MSIVVAVCGVFVGAIGVLCVVVPERFLALMRSLGTRGGFFFAVGFRLVMGSALYLAAPASRYPDFFRVFGVVAVVAGLALLFLGREVFRKLIDWSCAKDPGFQRVWGIVGVGLGVLLIHGVWP